MHLETMMFRLFLVLCTLPFLMACGLPQAPTLGGDDGGTSIDAADSATSALQPSATDPTETDDDDPGSTETTENGSDDPTTPEPTVPDQNAGLIDGDIFDGTGVDPGCGGAADCGNTSPTPELGVTIERIDPGLAGVGSAAGALRQ